MKWEMLYCVMLLRVPGTINVDVNADTVDDVAFGGGVRSVAVFMLQCV